MIANYLIPGFLGKSMSLDLGYTLHKKDGLHIFFFLPKPAPEPELLSAEGGLCKCSQSQRHTYWCRPWISMDGHPGVFVVGGEVYILYHYSNKGRLRWWPEKPVNSVNSAKATWHRSRSGKRSTLAGQGARHGRPPLPLRGLCSAQYRPVQYRSGSYHTQ